MDKTTAVIFFSLFGLLSLTTGLVILLKKEYFYARLKHKDFLTPASIRKVSGKAAKSDGIGGIIMGLVFLGLSVFLYLWGN